MCGCRTAMDEKLAPKNGRLAFGFSFSKGSMTVAPVMIQTEKIDRKKRMNPPIVLATFCPFCGEHLPDDGG